jgi:hypothetical protein
MQTKQLIPVPVFNKNELIRTQEYRLLYLIPVPVLWVTKTIVYSFIQVTRAHKYAKKKKKEVTGTGMFNLNTGD